MLRPGEDRGYESGAKILQRIKRSYQRLTDCRNKGGMEGGLARDTSLNGAKAYMNMEEECRGGRTLMAQSPVPRWSAGPDRQFPVGK